PRQMPCSSSASALTLVKPAALMRLRAWFSVKLFLPASSFTRGIAPVVSSAGGVSMIRWIAGSSEFGSGSMASASVAVAARIPAAASGVASFRIVLLRRCFLFGRLNFGERRGFRVSIDEGEDDRAVTRGHDGVLELHRQRA